MENDEFIKLIENLRDDVNTRLEGLIKIKFGYGPVTFDDIDERIAEFVQALDNLSQTISNTLRIAAQNKGQP